MVTESQSKEMTSGDDWASRMLIQELDPSLMLNVGVDIVALRSLWTLRRLSWLPDVDADVVLQPITLRRKSKSGCRSLSDGSNE
jgi:hypothetical protein